MILPTKSVSVLVVEQAIPFKTSEPHSHRYLGYWLHWELVEQSDISITASQIVRLQITMKPLSLTTQYFNRLNQYPAKRDKILQHFNTILADIHYRQRSSGTKKACTSTRICGSIPVFKRLRVKIPLTTFTVYLFSSTSIE